MKITPLAAESMGSRSMATFVETEGCNVLFDPGANVGPFRYGLPPHPLERFCLEKHRERIRLFARLADVIVITHYHFDHFTPDAPDIYRDKILFLKNPNQRINVSQRKRAFAFLKTVKRAAREITYADGRMLRLGGTEFVFSDPVPHGVAEKLGFVIQVAVCDTEKSFLFSSDIQGPCGDAPVGFILERSPEFLYLDGPVTYLLGRDASESLQETLERMKTIVTKTKVCRLIVDHHLLRDLQWRERIQPLFSLASRRGVSIQTAAEFRGEENNLLEARRNRLYEENPPEVTDSF